MGASGHSLQDELEMSKKIQGRSIITISFTVLLLLSIIFGLSLPAMSDGGVAFHADVTSGNAPLTVQFTDDTQGFRSGWIWSFGDGGSTAKDPSHTYNSPGTYDVSLTVSNGSGPLGTETKTAYITVYSQVPSAPVADFRMNTTTGPAPLAVQFTSLASAGTLSYYWDFGDGTQYSADQNPVHIYTTPNNYTVKLKVSNPGGSNVKTAQIVVTVPDKQTSSNNTSAMAGSSLSATNKPLSTIASDTPQSQGLMTFSISEDMLQIILTALIAIVIAFMIIYYFSSLSKREENKQATDGKPERKRHMPAIGKKAPATSVTTIPEDEKAAVMPAKPAGTVMQPEMTYLTELLKDPEAVKAQEAVNPPFSVKAPEILAKQPPKIAKPLQMPIKAPEAGKPAIKPEPKKSSTKLMDLLRTKVKTEPKSRPATKPARPSKKRNDVDKDYIYGLVLGENKDQDGKDIK